MKHRRSRYQQGSLTTEERKNGPAVWVYRWREKSSTGTWIKRKEVVGPVSEIKSRREAERAVSGRRLDINAANSAKPPSISVAEVVEHFKLVELPQGNRTHRTKTTYVGYIDKIILPRWGSFALTEVKAVMVERWLAEIAFAPATKAKTRAIFGLIFRHAIRYEYTFVNPIASVRQTSRRMQIPVMLELHEICDLLRELWTDAEPCFTIVFTAVVTGLRRGELIGLKWSDVDFEKRQINIVRSWVNKIVGEPKTFYSRRPIPLGDHLAAVLLRWRKITPYNAEEDWVFGSPMSLGKEPFWPDSMFYKRIQPAARRIGITKKFGWHSFRRSTASLLVSGGTSIRTTQDILRHASPTMTLGTYAQSVSSERMEAQHSIAALLPDWTLMDPREDPSHANRQPKLLK